MKAREQIMQYTPNAHLQLLQRSTTVANIASTIDAARRTINVLAYYVHISRHEDTAQQHAIIRALEKAASRSCRVRIILAEHTPGDNLSRDNRAFAERMRKHNADIRYAPARALMHAKMIQVDDYITFHLTSNLTNAAFTTNTEVNVMAASHTHAHACALRFSEIWAKCPPTRPLAA